MVFVGPCKNADDVNRYPLTPSIQKHGTVAPMGEIGVLARTHVRKRFLLGWRTRTYRSLVIHPEDGAYRQHHCEKADEAPEGYWKQLCEPQDSTPDYDSN